MGGENCPEPPSSRNDQPEQVSLITKAHEEVTQRAIQATDSEQVLDDHVVTYYDQFTEYVQDLGKVLIEKHGIDSCQVQEFSRGEGRWTRDALSERLTALFLARGREKTQRVTLAVQALDVAKENARDLGVPSHPEQTSEFASD
jgi:hypothetical protein